MGMTERRREIGVTAFLEEAYQQSLVAAASDDPAAVAKAYALRDLLDTARGVLPDDYMVSVRSGMLTPHEINEMTFAQLVAYYSSEIGVGSQAELAERIGVSNPRVTQMIQGDIVPNRASFDRLMGVFGINPDTVAGRRFVAAAQEARRQWDLTHQRRGKRQ